MYSTAVAKNTGVNKQMIQYPDYKNTDYTYYYTGRAYQYTEQYEKAKEVYIYARDNFPRSSLRDSIFTRINEVNAKLD